MTGRGVELGSMTHCVLLDGTSVSLIYCNFKSESFQDINVWWCRWPDFFLNHKYAQEYQITAWSSTGEGVFHIGRCEQEGCFFGFFSISRCLLPWFKNDLWEELSWGFLEQHQSEASQAMGALSARSFFFLKLPHHRFHSKITAVNFLFYLLVLKRHQHFLSFLSSFPAFAWERFGFLIFCEQRCSASSILSQHLIVKNTAKCLILASQEDLRKWPLTRLNIFSFMYFANVTHWVLMLSGTDTPERFTTSSNRKESAL